MKDIRYFLVLGLVDEIVKELSVNRKDKMKEFTESMKKVAEYIHGKTEKSDKINEWLHNNKFSKILDTFIDVGEGGKAEDGSIFEPGNEQTG